MVPIEFEGGLFCGHSLISVSTVTYGESTCDFYGSTLFLSEVKAMPFTVNINETCPKCRQPKLRAVFELHPSNPDLAFENFERSDCGPVKTKVISLKPRTKASEATA